MKIGIDISQIIYQGTGVARYVTKLVSTLLKINHKNEYILFGNSLRKKSILEDFYRQILSKDNNIVKKFYPLPATFTDILWNKLHILPIEWFTGTIDIFHTSDWVEPPAKAIKVTTVHDFLVFKYPAFFPKKIVETQKRRISWVIAESKIIIVDSKSTKNDGTKLLSIPEEKMVVIYPGVSENFKPRYKEEIEKVRKKYSITKEYILSVGTKEPRKNIRRIIEVFKKLIKDFDIEFVVVGKVGWGEYLRDSNPRIKFLGYVPDLDLPALYCGASCFVYPSEDEGFGLPVLEALACGTSVVTSRSGSLTEVGGKYAIYVDPQSIDSIAKGIQEVLENKNKKINKEAILWAKSFSWEKTAKEVLKVYQYAHRN